jgi:hypothetical protein
LHDFGAAPEWRLFLHGLADRLLRDIKDPQLRSLLAACAVVRQFDERTLAAMTGQDDVSEGFSQLCALSAVKATEHGLKLHDDVRRYVAADLSWRQPQLYSLLRSRALTHYRDRLRTSPQEDRDWLVAECFFLWGHGVIQEVFFSPEDPTWVRVEPRLPRDDDDIRHLFAERPRVMFDPEINGHALHPPGDMALLEGALAYEGTRVRVARSNGRVLGFSFAIPVCQTSLPFLRQDRAFMRLIEAYSTGSRHLVLPATAQTTNIFYLSHAVHSTESPAAVRAALLRDLAGLFALGGVYFACTPLPSYKRLLEACGFELIPGARSDVWGPVSPTDGYVLDLSRTGFENWIQSLIEGQTPPTPADLASLEKELQEVLVHWHDADWLKRSQLPQMLSLPGDGVAADRVRQLRETVSRKLEDALREAGADLQLAYRALELVYLKNGTNHKQAARVLSVSRATFYRLLKRGTRGLAQALA